MFPRYCIYIGGGVVCYRRSVNDSMLCRVCSTSHQIVGDLHYQTGFFLMLETSACLAALNATEFLYYQEHLLRGNKILSVQKGKL